MIEQRHEAEVHVKLQVTMEQRQPRIVSNKIQAANLARRAMYIRIVYTLAWRMLMNKARIFKSGNSQAVRLPKEFRFHVDEVEILRRGGEIVLREPKRNLEQAFEVLGAMPDDFMAEGRRDEEPQKRDEQ
jgi:antitoxin VapB